MRFKVIGVRRDNGEDATVTIDAPDEKTAAKKSGLVIESIEPLRELDPLEAFAATTKSAALSKLEYRTPPQQSRSSYSPPARNYEMVFLSGWIIQIAGWAVIAVSLVAIFMVTKEAFQNVKIPFEAIVISLVGPFVGLLSGILQTGFGSLILMARDTAMHLQSK